MIRLRILKSLILFVLPAVTCIARPVSDGDVECPESTSHSQQTSSAQRGVQD